ncbi:G-type lectin S-receptor-like serine/threonine-protein kinase LECRK3 [Cocos nucifera]|uniref:non-specific serine/threonine protein kinase n=1 Tax=Cocos nucifera TaxID=13894 RepID=A0A8K0IWQ0_COCNU|nr:G-type lectin S-receptor-like serine/threonine-protein kinase LECRK3 [Cocos nucifera]
MQTDGNLVQYPVASPHYPADANYASGTNGDGYLSLYLDDKGIEGIPTSNRSVWDQGSLWREQLLHIRKWTSGCYLGSDNVTYMSTLESVTWIVDSYAAPLSVTSDEDCSDACLKDCYCDAALFKDNTCTKQLFPLRYGMRDDSTTTFIKLVNISAGGNSHAESPAAASVIKIRRKYRAGRYRRLWRNKEPAALVDEIAPRSFSYHELREATDGFKEELGKGAFGTVFKGALPRGQRAIAVKKLEKVVDEGEREFRTEMRTIGRTHHKNLVRLLGFCDEGTNRLLVYEYMSNGSVADLIFKADGHPDWDDRVRIALDIARGIHYLHEDCETRIIHCDIKPENILMDDNWTAKIADFGLAKLLMPSQTRTFTGIRGTRGYLAPEWHKNAPITVKADVYSFGIVLLEIVCCRKNMELEAEEDAIILLDWVHDCFMDGELEKLVPDEVDMTELNRLVKVGLWCTQSEPGSRPSMKNVVTMLEANVDISLPPPPGFSS